MIPLAAGLAVKAATTLAAEFLPGLVGKLTGQKGERIARAVVDSASAAAGVDAAQEPDKAAARLRRDPALLMQFKVRVLEHDETMAELSNADRADARARDRELRKAGRFANLRADFLAVAVLFLLWRIIEALLGGGVPLDGAGRDAVFMLFGAVIALVKDVYQFEFGSSRGSKDKDERAATGGIARG